MNRRREVGPSLRMTRQRRALLAAIEQAGGHPTADEIYRMAKRRLPRISLGTIYRNLGILEEHGLVQSIEAPGGQRRFDAEAARHYHVRCTGCGRLDDVPIRSVSHVERAAQAATGYEIAGHRMEFLGLCRGCATERDRKCKGAQRRSPKQGGA